MLRAVTAIAIMLAALPAFADDDRLELGASLVRGSRLRDGEIEVSLFTFVLFGTTAVLNDALGVSHYTGQRALAPTVPNYVFFSGPAPECQHDHYCLGTELARSFYDAYLADGHDPHDPDARAELGREVLAALPLLPAAMRGYGDLPPPGPDQVACKLSKESSSAAQFVRALVEHLPAARRPALCAAMRHHFAGRFPLGGCP